MGKFYNTRTILDGLVFYLDAANPRCYSGSGFTATGLFGGIGATLVSGVAFSTQNKGSFFFDGTNDYMPFNVPNLGNTITIEMWANIKAFESGMPFGFNLYSVSTSTGGLGFNTDNSDNYGITKEQVVGLGLSSNWKNYHMVMKSDVPYTNNKIYINGEFQSLSQLSVNGENSTNRTFGTGIGKISGRGSGTSFMIPMNVAIFKIYNKELTQEEINLNFNAFKGRFGL